MTEYKIEFRPIARHNLRSLPKTIQKRIDILLLSEPLAKFFYSSPMLGGG